MHRHIQLLKYLALFMIILSFFGYCSVNQFKLFVLASGSMTPAISPGTLIVVQPQERYFPGDVITFSAAKEEDRRAAPVTHRVVSTRLVKNSCLYQTKGDANHYPDDKLVFQHEIYGKVILIIPVIGYLLTWPYSIVGSYFLVVLPAILISGYLLYRIISIVFNSS